jgi:hypothetical protein
MYYPIQFNPIVTWLIILPAIALIAVGIIKFLRIINRAK